MKLTPISEFITQITFLGVSNCFLVREERGLTLVDASLSGKGKHIAKAAQNLGLGITSIALTHAHSDHIGSVDELNRLLGIAELAVSAREARLLRKDLSLDPGEPRTTPRGGFPGLAMAPTHLLQHNDLFGSLQVIATPGHTPGHICFLDTRDGTLLAGDAFVGFGNLRVVTDAPWYFPLPSMATWDSKVALESAQRLAHYPIQRIAAGHGPATLHETTATLTQALTKALTKAAGKQNSPS